MKERFEGAGRSLLVDALRRQEFTGGSVEIAAALADAGTLEEYRPGDKLITQGGSDNDVYLLVMGVVALIINGAEHYSRKAGQHVGEMAAIEPMQPRSATVLASETTVALKVPCAEFLQIAERYPQVWRPMVRELSRRLYQRNSTIMRPNESPKLFIISSSEAIAVARAIRDGLGHDVFSTVWNEGVFFAGGYTLEKPLILCLIDRGFCSLSRSRISSTGSCSACGRKAFADVSSRPQSRKRAINRTAKFTPTSASSTRRCIVWMSLRLGTAGKDGCECHSPR